MEWPDLLRGPGPFALPCLLDVVLLAGRLGPSRHIMLLLVSLALPPPARLEMSLCLPTDTLAALFVAAPLLPPLAVPLGIPLLVVKTPLVVWMDLLIDPLAVAT